MPLAAQAQGAGTAPQERRERMAKVQEMLADPDPLMRLANMEAIVNEGDPLLLLVALRTALASDDADLRGLAMRAYVATRQRVTFDIILPATVQKQLDATELDPKARDELATKYRFLVQVLAVAGKFQLEFKDYAFPQDVGTLRNGLPFTITGDRFSVRGTMIPYFPECFLTVAPARTLSFEGTLACPDWPKLAVVARIF
jgi:hypothetical protein